MFTMLLNHIATIFLSSGTWLCESFLAIGYFTAITMTCFLVEGYHYTHSKKIYILRLFVFALISEIPYCFAFTTNGIIEFYGFNMLFTLCICFGILYILDTIKNRFAKVCLIILAVIISLFCDWALLAPIFTLLCIVGMGMAAVCIVFFYNGKRIEKGKVFSKWFFYLFYPVHLLILGILRLVFIE